MKLPICTTISLALAIALWQFAKTPATPNIQTIQHHAAEAPADIVVRMCPENEPGEPLEFYGRILDESGNPLEKASIIAYCTDATGLYVPPDAPRGTGSNPRLRAVAITNTDGWYRFRTIKPGPYPDAGDPAHIHLHVDAAIHQHMYRTFWFEGDPLITPRKRSSLDAETVIVPLRKRDDGVWTFRHDIRLRGS